MINVNFNDDVPNWEEVMVMVVVIGFAAGWVNTRLFMFLFMFNTRTRPKFITKRFI